MIDGLVSECHSVQRFLTDCHNRRPLADDVEALRQRHPMAKGALQKLLGVQSMARHACHGVAVALQRARAEPSVDRKTVG